MRFAVFGAHPGKARVVGLDPCGGIARAAVLPRREPQQHQPLVVRARLIEQRIDEAEIEPALLRLDLLPRDRHFRSEEHTSELPSLMRISYAVFCLQKKNTHNTTRTSSN